MSSSDPKISESLRALWHGAARRELQDQLKDWWLRALMMAFFDESFAMAKQNQNPNVYGKFLKGLQGAWKKNKQESAKGNVEVPKGTYIARLMSIKFHTFTQNVDGKPTDVFGCVGQFRVLVGDYAGELAPYFPKFFNDESTLYFMKDMRKLGVDVDNMPDDLSTLGAELKALTDAKPFARIKRVLNEQGYVNTRIDKGLTEEEVEAFGFNPNAVEVEGDAVGTEPAGEEEPEVVIEGEEPEPEVAPAPAPVKKATTAATPRPVLTAPTSSKAATRPAPKAPAKAPPPQAAEPEPEMEVGGDVEPEPELEPEGGDVEPEPEAPTVDIGVQVQFTAKGVAHRGIVKGRDDKRKVWIVREDGTQTNWPIPFTHPTLTVAEE